MRSCFTTSIDDAKNKFGVASLGGEPTLWEKFDLVLSRGGHRAQFFTFETHAMYYAFRKIYMFSDIVRSTNDLEDLVFSRLFLFFIFLFTCAAL